MPKKIEVDVYTLAELKEAAKSGENIHRRGYEKALEWVRQGQADGNYWHEDIIEDWTYNLNRIGFSSPRIFFSGFGSQGDGACFTCNSIDFKKMKVAISDAYSTKTPDRSITTELLLSMGQWKPLISRLSRLCNAGFLEMSIERGNSRYSHERTVSLTCDVHESKKIGKTAFMDSLESFKEDLESVRFSLCRLIYRDLENTYDYLVSDEACLDTAEANEYTFTAYGLRMG